MNIPHFALCNFEVPTDFCAVKFILMGRFYFLTKLVWLQKFKTILMIPREDGFDNFKIRFQLN